MSQPERFAEFVLFKRWTVDAMGMFCRASRLAQGASSGKVLLRIYSGVQIDPQAFAQQVGARSEAAGRKDSSVHEVHFAEGRAGRVPYQVYEYLSGRPLAEILTVTRGRSFPIPLDHALLMAERIAAGLAATLASGDEGEPLVHGFLVPEQILVSNVGEVQVVGFGVADGLWAGLPDEVTGSRYVPYLSPERLSEWTSTPEDDVYSLGAILFELLTGERFSPGTQADVARVLEEARLAVGNDEIPSALRVLLAESLCPVADRISNAGEWHQQLSRVMQDGEYSPTTFNLGYFLSTLFREEIATEMAELAAERELVISEEDLPIAEVGASADVVEDGRLRVPSSLKRAELPSAEEIAEEISAPTSTPRRFGVGAVLALFVAVVFAAMLMLWWGLSKRSAETHARSAAAAESLARSTAVLPPAVVPAGQDPTSSAAQDPAVLEEQLRQLVEERSQEMEDSLRVEYESELTALREKIQAARAARREAEDERDAEESREAAGELSDPPPGIPAMERESSLERHGTEDGPLADAAPATRDVSEVRERTRSRALVEAQEIAPAEVGEQVSETDSVTASPVEPPQPIEETAPPAIETVSTPAVLLGKPRPSYPRLAERLGKSGTVTVRILVDESGVATKVERVGPEVGFGFDEAAIKAVGDTTWEAATLDGVPVSTWAQLRIEFHP